MTSTTVRTPVAYGFADHDYQDEIPVGAPVVIYEYRDDPDDPELDAWEIIEISKPNRTAIVPAGSVAQYDLIAQNVLGDLAPWAYQCHAASLKLVQSGLLGGPSRVARGTCTGVPGQHSWVVIGTDCYDDDAIIIDPTLWSYDDYVGGVWVTTYREGRHHPFGKGSIWNWGRPDNAVGPIIELTPKEPFSDEARLFLNMLGPLDRKGWGILAHAPVQGWPSREIFEAIYHTEGLAGIVPIDIIGMVTDLNPEGLYLPNR